MPKKVYGAGMTPFGVFLFAQTYRAYADALVLVLAEIRPRSSDHPRRFLYFQALENYLRSFLLLKRRTPAQIRTHQHRFADMLDECKDLGLKVPNKTAQLIRSRTVTNDYTRIRYDYQLDDGPPGRAAQTLERLQMAVWEIEQAIGMAIQATGVPVLIGKRPRPSN